MRGFTLLGLFGLLMALAGCQSGDEARAEPPGKGGPNEPGEDPPAPQPSSASTVPTTGVDGSTTVASTSSTSSTSSSELGGTTGAPSTSTGAPVPEACGDGELDPGEQCDAGYQDNNDSAACTKECKLAACGDGLLWVGEEQCDHGANNNDAVYNGCSESCEFGPRCGDGVLQPDDEECDASAPAIEGLAPCDPVACRYLARIAFVSDAKFFGALGGLALADAACVAAAVSQGFDNSSSFKAWLSDGVAAPQTRLKQAAEDPGYPYVRRDGQLLAEDLADLIAHGPKLPLEVTETGAVLAAQEPAWTNIGADGAPFSVVNHCKEWTSKGFLDSARVGKISPASAAELAIWKAERRWTSAGVFTCNYVAHIYCFED